MSGFAAFLTGALDQANQINDEERDFRRRYLERFQERFDRAYERYGERQQQSRQRISTANALKQQGIPDPVIRQWLDEGISLEDIQAGNFRVNPGAPVPSPAGMAASPVPDTVAPIDASGNVRGEVSPTASLLFGTRSGEQMRQEAANSVGLPMDQVRQIMSGQVENPQDQFQSDPNASVTVLQDPTKVLRNMQLRPEDFRSSQDYATALQLAREGKVDEIAKLIDPNLALQRQSSLASARGPTQSPQALIARLLEKIASGQQLTPAEEIALDRAQRITARQNFEEDVFNGAGYGVPAPSTPVTPQAQPPAQTSPQTVFPYAMRPSPTQPNDQEAQAMAARIAAMPDADKIAALRELGQQNPVLQNRVIDILKGK